MLSQAGAGRQWHLRDLAGFGALNGYDGCMICEDRGRYGEVFCGRRERVFAQIVKNNCRKWTAMMWVDLLEFRRGSAEASCEAGCVKRRRLFSSTPGESVRLARLLFFRGSKKKCPNFRLGGSYL